MGEWQKTVGPDPRYPCTNCQSGSSSISSRIDPVTGELWSKSDGCSETCERLREFNEPPDEPLFGEHIREAYAAITGKQRAQAKSAYPPVTVCTCEYCQKGIKLADRPHLL